MGWITIQNRKGKEDIEEKYVQRNGDRKHRLYFECIGWAKPQGASHINTPF